VLSLALCLLSLRLSNHKHQEERGSIAKGHGPGLPTGQRFIAAACSRLATTGIREHNAQVTYRFSPSRLLSSVTAAQRLNRRV
jgi:hypothetical protein